MAWKFYAVRHGKTRGVVTTWAECQAMVNGVSGAEYKGFNLEEEAYAYLNGQTSATASLTQIKKPDSPEVVNVYARGRSADGIADIGVVIESQSKTWEFFGEIVNSEFRPSRGFGGELVATMVAAQLCRELGFTQIHILNKYEGVEKWFNGTWTARDFLPIEFVKCLKWLEGHALMHFSFQKISKGTKSRWLSDAERLVSRSGEQRKYIDPHKTFMCQLVANDVPLFSIS